MRLSFLTCYFFFFKQKTAYELRISDWSSDVCSSDLSEEHARFRLVQDTAFPETGAHHVIELDGGISHRRRIRPKREELSAPFIRPPLLPAAPAIIAPRGTAIEDDAAPCCEHGDDANRSEERRVGKECVSTCRSRR